MKVQSSDRLSYELMGEQDAALLFKLDQDPEVMRYINGGKMTTMEEIIDTYIPRLLSYTNHDEGWGMWKVTLKENNDFLGWILIRPMEFFTDKPELDNLEIGWRFMRNSWGKGYATEAALSVKQAIIERGKATRLSAVADEDNVGSINIMRKLGMQYIKTDIHEDPLGDIDAVYYELKLS